MINDIHESLDIQHIEEQKQIALENAKNEDLNPAKVASATTELQKPKTRKELREERQRFEKLKAAELEVKKKGNLLNIPFLLARFDYLL